MPKRKVTFDMLSEEKLKTRPRILKWLKKENLEGKGVPQN